MSYYTWQQIIDKNKKLQRIEESKNSTSFTPKTKSVDELIADIQKRKSEIKAQKSEPLTLDLFDFTPLTESEVKFEKGLKILSQLASTYHPA